jgi:photosystem II stability/assembly factor-like uncharacterized protein
MRGHAISPVLWVGLGIVGIGASVSAYMVWSSAEKTAELPQNEVAASASPTASAEVKTATYGKDTGYTGIAGDVMTNQRFECAPRSEHEWYRTGRTLAVDPTNPQVMYVSVEYKGVYKSTDGGATWKSSSKGIRAYAREDDPTKACYSEYPVIRINPKNNNHIVIGLSSGGGGHLHPSNINQQVGGVYQSFNAGESWELMIDNTMNTYVTDVAIDADGAIYYGTASNPGSWTEADQNKLFVSKGLIYKTTDNGLTWTELPTGIGSRSSATRVFVNDKNTKQIVAPTYSAVRLSADGTGTGISNGKDTSVAQIGLLSSADGGLSWSKQAFPDDAPVLLAAASPTNFANQYYISASGSDAYVTFDAGQTFTKSKYMTIVAYDPFDTSGKRMLAYSMQSMDGPGLTLHESTDGGLSWKAKGTLPAEITSLQDTKTRVSNIIWHPTNKNTVYMSGGSGYVWVSTNLGTSWKRLLSYTEL